MCYDWSMTDGVELAFASTAWGREQARSFLLGIVDYRRELGVSAAEIARLMEVVPEVVYRLEQCQRDARLSTLLRYCHVLGLTVNVTKEEAA